MRFMAISALLLAISAGPLAFAQEGGDEEDPIVKLKKILAKMEQVEELLAKTRLDAGSAEQSEIIKALEQKVKEGKLKQEDVVAEADKQLKVVLKKMESIDAEMEKVIQMAKLEKGGGGSGMDMKNPKDKSGEKEQGEKRKEQEGDLKEMKPEDQQKQAGKDKGKEGQKKEGGEGGKDPADKPYNAEGRDAAGAAKRAEAGGRWGDLPLKEFNEALASGKIKAPEKYLSMIRKYMEMLAKKAAEDK